LAIHEYLSVKPRVCIAAHSRIFQARPHDAAIHIRLSAQTGERLEAIFFVPGTRDASCFKKGNRFNPALEQRRLRISEQLSGTYSVVFFISSRPE